MNSITKMILHNFEISDVYYRIFDFSFEFDAFFNYDLKCFLDSHLSFANAERELQLIVNNFSIATCEYGSSESSLSSFLSTYHHFPPSINTLASDRTLPITSSDGRFDIRFFMRAPKMSFIDSLKV